MENPRGVVEGLVDRAVAIDEPRSADAIRIQVPRVDGRCGLAGAAGDRRVQRAAGSAVPDDEFLGGEV
jgi:hypothetical protein